MFLYEFYINLALKEGEVVDFPSHLAKRSQLMKRLGKASSDYDEDGNLLPPEEDEPKEPHLKLVPKK